MPYGRRARHVAAMGGGLALAMAAGTLAAPWAIAAVLVTGAIAGAAAFAGMAAELPPPREFFVVLTCLLATGLPLDPGAAPERAALVLAGAALAWIVSMGGALIAPRAPEEAAVRGAYERVAALLRAVGSARAEDAQHDAVVAVRAAHAAVRWAGGTGGADFVALRRRTMALEALLDAGLSLVIVESPPLDPRVAEVVEQLADVDWPQPVVPAGLLATLPATPAAPRLAR